MAKPENLTCPECGGEMVSRLNREKNQRFWGCKTFPTCRGTRDTDGRAPAERRHRSPGYVVGEHEEGADLPSSRLRENDRRRWDR